MTSQEQYTVLGIISGSSMDGLDLALVDFEMGNGANPIDKWSIRRATTMPFDDELVQELQDLNTGFALDFVEMDDRLGAFFASCCGTFLDGEKVDYISSHGHTIFHHPGTSSTQIGNPAMIAARLGIPTIGHLRNMDTAYGGEGAPLAPMADLYLFEEYEVCVNLGGIANISIKEDGGIIGYDLCGANQILNHLANQKGLPYDDGGALARSGTLNQALLNDMNALPYCLQASPKSLDNQQTKSMYFSLLEGSTLSIQDQLRTVVQHIIEQIKIALPENGCKVLMTGGGALNTFLIERLRAETGSSIEIVVPPRDIIEFKESVLIAMCGLLRIKELPNSLASITGASKDTVNGVVFLP